MEIITPRAAARLLVKIQSKKKLVKLLKQAAGYNEKISITKAYLNNHPKFHRIVNNADLNSVTLTNLLNGK